MDVRPRHVEELFGRSSKRSFKQDLRIRQSVLQVSLLDISLTRLYLIWTKYLNRAVFELLQFCLLQPFAVIAFVIKIKKVGLGRSERLWHSV